MKKLFIDSDGTMFHWSKDIELNEIIRPGYFRDLDIYQNVVEGIKMFEQQNPDVEIYVATHVLNYPHVIMDKRKAFKKHIPFIKPNHIIYIPYEISKDEYIGDIDEECYLLDDYSKNLVSWERAGGQTIKLVNDINSLPDKGCYIHYSYPAWMICEHLEKIIKGEMTHV